LARLGQQTHLGDLITLQQIHDLDHLAVGQILAAAMTTGWFGFSFCFARNAFTRSSRLTRRSG
jgi:hypothetical protein